MVPLAAVSNVRVGYAPLFVHHQGFFVATTISFNLQPGRSLGQAVDQINSAIARIHMPATIHGTLAGNAQLFQQSLGKEPILIASAIAAVYILGHAVRELHLPDHNSLDATVGRCGIVTSPDNVWRGI